MENKKMRITMDDKNNIIIYVNDKKKKEISSTVNSISAIDIYNILELSLNDKIILEPIDEKKDSDKKYKMLYELFENLVKSLNEFSETINYDVDIEIEKKELKDLIEVK